ncbi:MAG: hypothetical protein M3Z84_07420 [Actinomycetota bacterium]|nr:hypothetical protein [Actinomycetota bacterium]
MTQESLQWRDWCCLSCRRIRHTVAFVADLGACEHGKKCLWGLDKYDGSCVPTGVPSESLHGLTDPPVVTDRKRWPAPKGNQPWPAVA